MISINVVWIGIVVVLIVVLAGIRCLSAKLRERSIMKKLRKEAADHQDRLATISVIWNCLKKNLVYEYKTNYGDIVCPKCGRETYSAKLLTQYDFPWHWWLCKCSRHRCGYSWISIAKDDNLRECKSKAREVIERTYG